MLKSKPLENDPNRNFNFKNEIPLDVTETEMKTLKIFMKILDDDTVGSNVIGGLSIILRDVFEKPGTWIS